MSNTTYYNPNSELCLEIRQWFLDNPQDDSDYESFNGWGGWNEKIHRNIDRSSIVMGENNSFYGKSHSEETKRKLSEKNTGYVHTEEARKKMSEKSKGKKKSETHRKKISEAQKGKIISEETRRKMSIAQRKRFGTL